MSNESVIDNENVVLLDQLKLHLPNTTRASIAVGYFFISGFAAIMDSFTKIEQNNNPEHVIRLLISPKTNRPTAEALLASNESLEDARRKVATDQVDGKAIASKQIRESLGHMPQTSQDRHAALKLVELIRKGKLQVKVYTKTQLHAKAYIFEMMDNPALPRFSIVGSSNLSISGIKEHTELNLRTNVDNDSEKLLEWFDRHWEEAKEFTKEMADEIQDSWVDNRPPIDIYHKAVMYEYGEQPGGETGGGEYEQLFEFQKMAVLKAIKMLEDYGGVIVADVVGTGKSFIGSMILKYLKEVKRAKPLIICPPHLMDMWDNYMRLFNIHAEVVSRYKIGMKDNILNRYTNCDVILVDESHNFRNKTNAYEKLKEFMEQQNDDASIIMLTATPISNGVMDIKNQLNLFPAERIQDIPPLGNTSLDEYFKGTESDHQLNKEGEEKIQELLRHILIRRTRRQIRNYAKKDGNRYYLELKSGERRYFPKRNLTTPRQYDINKVYQNSFDNILDHIEELTMARYSPGDYIKEEYRNTTHREYRKYNDLANHMRSLIGMVRTGLLKRMESSIAAFATSVENYRKGSQKFLDFLKRGIVPIGKDYQDAIYKSIIYDDDEYDDDERLGESDYSINAFDVGKWRADLIHDIGEFGKILNYLPNPSYYHKIDDKFDSLLEELHNRDEKVLLFTESRVTAEYIYKRVREAMPHIHAGQIDSKKSTTDKRDMVRRFDPKNNNNAAVSPEDQIDLLVSTDVLSEGVNLQAGRTVINYDFHWNPVRLIQRVGRIDRIGSEHEIVDVVNFLPTTQLETHLGLRERVSNKIDIIRRIIGQEQNILEPSEKIDESAVINIYAGVEDVLDMDSKGILDMVQTTAERDAEAIQTDQTLRSRIARLPLGIKNSVGSGKILVACEADEVLLSNDTIIDTKTFRRYYEVSDDGIKEMIASSFLDTLEKVKDGIAKDTDGPQHDMLIRNAWAKFTREMKNEQARKRSTKIQTYFEKKLNRIGLSENPNEITKEDNLSRRSMLLIPRVKKMMIRNKQPYTALYRLRKKIDTGKLSNKNIIEEMESILKEDYKYKREIGKPRILYSMEID